MTAAIPADRTCGRHTTARLAALAIILLAFALRAYHLDFQSLWSDEGISLLRSSQTLPDLIRNMPVEHMPGYFLLLHFWLPAAGASDVALRFPSTWLSTLAAALIFRLAVDLQRPKGRPAPELAPAAVLVALSAMLLLATGAFQVWYAQEARMYAPMLTLALLSTWFLWRLLDASGQRAIWWGAGYAVATAGVVYQHFFGALVPVAQALFVLGWVLVRRDGRGFLRWLLASLGALILFLPWLPRSFGIFGFGGWRAPGNVAEIPWRYLAAYTVGDPMPEPWRGWLPWLYLVLALGGLVYWWRRRRSALLLLLTLGIVPFAAVLALAARNPDYHERYSIYLTFPLILLAAGGLGLLDVRFWLGMRSAAAAAGGSGAGAVSRRSGWFGAGVVIGALLLAGANGVALQELYTNPAVQKPDYRGAAEQIMAHLQPGDVVLVDGPDPKKVFLHYYTGAAPVHEVTSLQDKSYEKAGAKVNELTAGARRVWELLYFHEPAAVQMWLATQAWATELSLHNGIRVTLYGLAAGRPITQPLNIDFGPALTLQQAEVNTQTPAPGDLLRVTTRWFVHAQAPEFKFSLRLADAAGNTAAAADYVPQNWFAPTNVWIVGQPAADQRGLLLPTNLAPGSYRLTLRLYDPASGAAVDTSAGQDVLLAQLTVH